jgi:uncharacterized membrane protein YkoI
MCLPLESAGTGAKGGVPGRSGRCAVRRLLKEFTMRLGLILPVLAIALILVAGTVSGLYLWTGGQAAAAHGDSGTSAQKSDAPKAPAVKADDDDDEEEVEGDDDDEDDDGDDDGAENEVEVTIDQVPDFVKAAILAAAGSNPIKEIEKETENGQTTYEAEWIANGQEVEITVTADGTVVKRKAKKADDDDKDQHGEH